MVKKTTGKNASVAKKTAKAAPTTTRRIPDITTRHDEVVATPRNRNVVSLATRVLGEVTGEFNEQYTHPGNQEIDLEEFYDRLEDLRETWRANGGLVPSKANKDFDWEEFVEELKKFRFELPTAIWNYFSEKANRMAGTGKYDQEQIDDMWAEAHPDGNPPPKKLIWGYVNLCRTLEADGCYDPNDQPRVRGGRQQGRGRK